jgi:hypothetical protein
MICNNDVDSLVTIRGGILQSSTQRKYTVLPIETSQLSSKLRSQDMCGVNEVSYCERVEGYNE